MILTKKPMRAVSALLAACLILPFTAAVTLAQEETPTGQFSVRAIIPDNQMDPQLTYFDIRMSPGQQQTLQVTVTNSSDSPITAYTALNAATTSSAGLISYAGSDIRDDSMEVSVEDVATVADPELVIAAGAKKNIRIDVAMPDTEFDGVMLGGISITAAHQTAEPQDPAQGISLQNELQYVIGLKITQNDAEVAPDFVLKGVESGLVNHRTAVTFHLQNPKPRIVKDMTVLAQVFKGRDTEPYQQMEMNSAEMAPHSTAPLYVDWNNNPLAAGDYRLFLRLEYDGQVWEWDESFAIAASDAGAINSAAVSLQTSRSWIWISFLLILVVALAVLFYYLGKRTKRREQF